jgi:hypothetical protein
MFLRLHHYQVQLWEQRGTLMVAGRHQQEGQYFHTHRSNSDRTEIIGYAKKNE